MKSKITIDVDQDNQPIIKVEYSESDDVRDKLVKRFIENFGHNSNSARVEWGFTKAPYTQTLEISPKK